MISLQLLTPPYYSLFSTLHNKYYRIFLFVMANINGFLTETILLIYVFLALYEKLGT